MAIPAYAHTRSSVSVLVAIVVFLIGMLRQLFGPRSSYHTRTPISTHHATPIFVVLVLDASGSMLGDDWPPSRLEGAKAAAKAYLSRIRSECPDARIAIIAYGSRSRVHCYGERATDHRAIAASIDDIRELGCTNIRHALKRAKKLLPRRCADCRLVLLSDGWHNAGGDPRDIADDIRKRAQVDTVGIGGAPMDVDEELLKYIATEHPDGRKRYRWIGSSDGLVHHFDQLAGRLRKA